MNILVFHFKESFQIELLNRIIASRPNDTFYFFWDLPGVVQSPNVIDKSADFLNLLTGFEISFKFSDLRPLDQEVLAEMAPYEYMSKRILQRYVTLGYTNKFFRRKRTGMKYVIDSAFTTLGDSSSSFVLSFDELHDHYLKFLRYWTDFYSKNRVDYIIADQVPHNGLDYISYAVSTKYNVKCIFGHFIPVAGNQVFYDGFSVEAGFVEQLKINRNLYTSTPVPISDSLKAEMQRLRSASATHWTGDFKLHQKLWDDLAAWKKKILMIQLGRIGANNFGYSFVARALRYITVKSIQLFAPASTYEGSLKAIMRKLAIKPDLKCKYVFMPLHYQSEASSQPIGGYYERQLLIIEQLSQCAVKDGFQVYIKEHNKMSEPTNRDAHFYERIAALPGVALIDAPVTSIDLIRGAIAVATISGTASWEAFILGKPVLLFGFNLLYAADKGVYRIRRYDDLLMALSEIQQSQTTDLAYVDAFMKTVDEYYPSVSTERYTFMRSQVDLDSWCKILAEEFLKRLKA